MMRAANPLSKNSTIPLMKKILNRRQFLQTATQAGAGAMAFRYAALAGLLGSATAPNLLAAETDKPVKLGGKPVRKAAFPVLSLIHI